MSCNTEISCNTVHQHHKTMAWHCIIDEVSNIGHINNYYTMYNQPVIKIITTVYTV